MIADEIIAVFISAV